MTRSVTILRPVVVVMGLTFFPAPLSWRAKRGRELQWTSGPAVQGRAKREIILERFHRTGRESHYGLLIALAYDDRTSLIPVNVTAPQSTSLVDA
ncbi:MAG: hypothetical protein QM730_23890 [Anaerolineales bacterium]